MSRINSPDGRRVSTKTHTHAHLTNGLALSPQPLVYSTGLGLVSYISRTLYSIGYAPSSVPLPDANPNETSCQNTHQKIKILTATLDSNKF